MSRRSAHTYRQRGVAVVTALLLTTLAITIVASLFWQQQVQVRSIENQRLQLQKQWILRGALDWARLILRVDGEGSPTDNLTEAWAVPLEETPLDQYVENGRGDADASDAALSGSIIDAQSRFNLGNLVANGKTQFEYPEKFAQLLVNLQLPPSLAAATVKTMIAAQLPSPEPNAPRPVDIRYVEDLLAVPGFTAEAYEKIKDYVIVLPRPQSGGDTSTKVNINTASPEVLAAVIDNFSLPEAVAFVASRKQAYLNDINHLKNYAPQAAPNPESVSVATNYFIVNGDVRLNRASLKVQSLISRKVDRGRTSTEVIWIREN